MGNTALSQEVVHIVNKLIHLHDMPMKVGISPGKAAELNLKQLHYLHGLYDDNIIIARQRTC